MNRSIRLLSTLTIGLSALAIAPSALADESFALHLDTGVSQPLTFPQSNIYTLGEGINARGMFNLRPWLTVGPVVEASYFPKLVDDGSNAGTLWQFGGAVRLQRSHDNFGANGYWSPYVNMDLTAGYTGDLWRPTLGFQVGLDVPTDSQHSVWFGPYLGYTHVFQTASTQNASLLDPNDVNLFTGGVSLTFDFPPHSRQVVRVIHDQTPTVVNVVSFGKNEPCEKAAPAREELSLVHRVYFDKDRATLRWESKDKLDEVVARLQKFPNRNIHVQGHASSEGQKSRNEKLAAERADAVRNYLVSHGVDSSRLTVDSFGVDRPAADNKTAEGRERSRRVEFEITVTTSK